MAMRRAIGLPRWVWRQVSSPRLAGARLPLAWLLLLSGMALGADFLASDKPLYLDTATERYWLANIVDPPGLRGRTVQELRAAQQVDARTSGILVTTPIAWGPNQQDTGYPPLMPPSSRHWLGTDLSRRDVAARLVHGARIALWVSSASVTLYLCIGVVLGVWAGFFGGAVDVVVTKLTETVIAVPAFFLLLAIRGFSRDTSEWTIVLSLGLLLWARVARLARAETIRLRGSGFVDAARALGYSNTRIMVVHILPNIAAPVVVAAVFGLAGAVRIEAALSFLGFGVDEWTPSWGGLLHQALGQTQAWWLVLAPGLALFSLVLAYNALGEFLLRVLAVGPQVHD